MIPSDCSVGLMSLIRFTSGYIYDSIFNLWQKWSKFEGVLSLEWNYSLLPYISFFLSESEAPLPPDTSLEISEHLKILLASIREYFPSARNDVSWLEYPFSASTGYLDLRLGKIEHLTDISPDGNLIDVLKPTTGFEFWSLPRSEYSEIANHAVQQLLSLFQHTALRKHFRNRSSLRTIKEADLILKWMFGFSYSISNLTSETDTWRASTSI